MEGSRSILSNFAYFLIEHNILEKDIALKTLEQSILKQSSYIELLTKEKLVNETDIARIAAEYFGFPLFDIQVFKTDLIPAEYLQLPAVKKRLALPLFKKNRLLYLAVADPTIESLYEIRFSIGLDIRFFIVEMSKLEKMHEQVNHAKMMSIVDVTEAPIEEVSRVKTEEVMDGLGYDVDSAPVVNFLNQVIMDAIKYKASDIHFERYENSYRIRFRQQGVLASMASPPSQQMAKYVLSRIKMIANLDMSEQRAIQVGRFKLNISDKKSVDFLVTVCPTLFGEKMVLHILDPQEKLGNIESLGMETSQREQLLHALNKSQGMILVAGPANSGKTVTVYSSLCHLNTVEKNISTVEDPVEVVINGLNQVSVNKELGITYPNVLQTFLEQDSDIMMVGEIEDKETAEVAFKVTQAGRLLLSTMYANNSLETLARLINIGVTPFDLASTVSLIISQRLVRVLCDQCKVKEKLSKEILIANGFKKDEIDHIEFFRPSSCEQCQHGFIGRVPIFEMLPMTEEVAGGLFDGKSLKDIEIIAKQQGMVSLWESGLQKIREGKTSLVELHRVFK